MALSNGWSSLSLNAIVVIIMASVSLKTGLVEGFGTLDRVPTNNQLGDSCRVDGDCPGAFEVCDGPSKKCVCEDTHYDSNGKLRKGGECLSKVDIGQVCKQQDACAARNSICVSGKCECKPRYYADGTVCRLRKLLGAGCTVAKECLAKNSFCDTGTCACKPNFYDTNGVSIRGGSCLAKVELGETCSRENACAARNSECDARTCVCESDYYADGEICRPRKRLGLNCECNNQCDGATAVCDDVTSKCVCRPAFYDTNGQSTIGGDCNAKVPLGGMCSKPDACAASNSICDSNQCICDSGFYVNGPRCSPLVELGGTCVQTSDCEDSSAQCTEMPPSSGSFSCRCPDAFHVDSVGDCVADKSLGSACNGDDECSDSNAVCDSSLCVCDSTTYDSTGTGNVGGSCVAKVVVGDPCPQDDACADTNAECDGADTCVCQSGYYADSDICKLLVELGGACNNTSDCEDSNADCIELTPSSGVFTCQCPDAFHLDSIGDCVADKSLGSACNGDDECSDSNAVCDSSLCVCDSTTYDSTGTGNVGGSCVSKVMIGAACPQPDACSDANAVCNGGNICECQSGYYDNVYSCSPSVELGGTCSLASNCEDSNADCIELTPSSGVFTCQCPDAFHLDSIGDCVADKDLGSACNGDDECSDSNAVCDSSLCVCDSTTYDSTGTGDVGGSCVAKVAIGVSCPQADACEDDNAVCNGGSVCECQSGYYDELNVCLPVVDLGGTCNSTSDCEDANAECTEETPSSGVFTCQCPDAFHLDSIGDCVADEDLGSACNGDDECSDSNAVCDSSLCVCDSTTYDSTGTGDIGGSCVAKVAIGVSCPQADACEDDNAVCNGGSVCECQSGYYDELNVCLPVVDLGGTCNSTSDCEDSNAECTEETPSSGVFTCQCPDAFHLDSIGDCVADKALGSACSGDDECSDSNAVCDSSLCVCDSTTYDSTGTGDIGGSCVAKVALGVACPQSDACSDVNAECSTTCVCITDYYNNAGTCEPLLCIGETCAATSDCKGSNVECSGTPLTCRCPSDRYLDVTTGNCLTKLVLGDSCESGQCGTTNSFCDTDTSLCICEEDYFDDNGATSGGSCTTKLALGVACSQTDACSDVNAECSTTCVCITDYYNNGGTCEPLSCIGETCATASDCKGSDVECSGTPLTCRCPSDRYIDVTTGNCLTKLVLGDSCESGQCGTTNSFCDTDTSLCICEEDYFDDNGATSGGSCTTKLALGVACSQTDACSDVNAECSTTCVCITDYYNNGGTCEPLSCIGETCATASDCKGSDVECAGTPLTCRCPSDRYIDVTTGNCLTKLVLGDSCESGQCGTTNSFCDTDTSLCICEEDYFDDNGATSGGSCTTKLALGVACSQTDACSDVNAECSTTCVCITDYYNNGGTCEPLSCIGETCATASDCKGSDVECSGTPLTCRCPSDRYIDVTTGNCLTKLVLGDSCESGQCGTTNSFCDTDTSLCICEEDYFDDNGATSGGSCTTKLALGVACSQTDACSDVNAECSTTCVCITDYYNNDGTCEPSSCIGEPCATASDCKGSDVECSGTPLTCRCPSDRYIDVTTGNCLTKLVLGDSCESGQCGTTNSFCDTDTSLCICEEDYFDDNGATTGGSCTTKLALDAACSQTDACSDVNAECSTTCVCITDYYNNGGTCEPLLCIGETCAATTDCKGSNVECSGTPLTCRCPSDRYLDVTTGNCLTKLVNGETCEAGQCGDTNAICHPGTNTCECPSGYIYDGANCLNCPSSDWQVYDGSCYLFGSDDLLYEASRTFCDTFDSGSDNSNLVQVDTSGELTFLKDFMTNQVTQATRGYWNDLYQATTNGNEVWRTSGDPLVISDWNVGQPRDNNDVLQECTLFLKGFSYRQADFPCSSGTGWALCEITPA